MSCITSYLPLCAAIVTGTTLLETGIALAQPSNADAVDNPSAAATRLAPASNPESSAPATQAATPEAVETTAAPALSAAPSANESVPESGVALPVSQDAAAVQSAVPVQPIVLARDVYLQLVRLKLLKRDRRAFTLGVGPLVLANTHWLDQPSDKSVGAGGLHSVDNQYPGFVGIDATLGLMLDLRYLHFLGVELDVFLQNDRGTGTINIQDAGSICFIPGVKVALPTHSYEVTIGQMAWHVPLLFKLSLPGRWERVTDSDGVEHEIRQNFGTLALGPEFVFPRTATFNVEPSTGLDHPERAFASNYVMYTGALGFERRLLVSSDMRLLFSLRGSYNPSAGGSAMKRAEYAAASGNVVAVAYRSEWRYQAALTLGLGWFF